MGRRGARVTDDARWVFNRLAEGYAARPGYPAWVVERLCELAGPEGRIADLGAGTGQLALPLAARGHPLTAVEPARRMLDQLVARAAQAQVRVEAAHAAAEATGLLAGAFDLVVVADALQWVDPELAGAEAARLLRPGGALAVVESVLGGEPFMDELLEIAQRRNPRAGSRPRPGALAQLFQLGVGAVPHSQARPERLPLDPSALEGALRSLSFLSPALGEPLFAQLLDEVRAVAERQGGAVWARTITVHAARSSPGR